MWSGLMVSVHVLNKISCLGSIPGWDHFIVFLGKTLPSHRDSFQPGAQMGSRKFSAGAMDKHLIQGGLSTNIPGCFMQQKTG